MPSYPNISNIQGYTTKNYNTAKEYYRQKREAFKQFVEKENEDFLDKLVDYINTKIETFDQDITKAIFDGLSDDWNQNINMITNTANQKRLKETNYSIIWENLYNKLANNKIKNSKSLAAALGVEFEKFLADSLVPEEFTKNIEGITNELVNSLLKSFTQTGAIKSRGATVAGKKDIRPDMGFNIAGGNYKNKVAKLPNSTLSVELQALIDLSQLSSKNITGDKSGGAILKQYLEADSYGFSAKIWKDSNSKVFANSSVLKNQFQKVLNSSGNKTWSSIYASAYVVYQLSRYLINIINPLNIAMITGSQLIWMDEFIDRHLFYMDIQMNNLVKSSSARGGGWEGHPKIQSTSIKLRQMSANNLRHEFISSINSKTGVISIRNRRITVK